MHVLLLNQFFHPDVSAVAQLAMDLAEDLAAAGFRVTAVASRGTYLGGSRLPRREEHNGVQIVRLPSTSLGKATTFAQLMDYGSFFASALTWVGLTQKPDVILATSMPPLVALIAAAMRAVRTTRFVYWAQDLYPELAIEFDVLRRDSPAARVLESLSSLIVQRADAVIALGDAMAHRIVRKGAPSSRVHVVPNWADPDAVRPVDRAANPLLDLWNLEGKRVVLYSGNMGRAHDLETILRAAELLRSRKDITFLFIGEGAKRAQIERAALTNPSVRLLPYQPRASLSQSLSAGDLHIVTQEPNTEGLVEPSKLYGVMAVGRPVVFIGPEGSEVARTIRREGLGEVVPNGDARRAAEVIAALLEQGTRIGASARATLVRDYGRHTRTGEIARILRSVAENAHEGRGSFGEGFAA